MKQPDLPKLKTVTLEGYTLNVQHYLMKEYDDVGVAAVELPAIIEWLNTQLQGQIELKYCTKAELGRAEAKAYFRLKQGGFQQEGYGDKATDSAIEYAIRLDADVMRLEESVAVVTGWVERIERLQRSFQAKLELVRSFEATRRGLMNTP